MAELVPNKSKHRKTQKDISLSVSVRCGVTQSLELHTHCACFAVAMGLSAALTPPRPLHMYSGES